MTSWIVTVGTTGALFGGAVAAVLAARARWHPVLADALRAVDERTQPRSQPAPATRPRAMAISLLRRVPFSVPADDLRLLDLDRNEVMLRAAGNAAMFAACGPVLAVAFMLLDLGVPPVLPAGYTIAGMVLGWSAAARKIRVRADTAREELRSALVCYLQQVGLLRRGGAGVSTALALPARLMSDSWAMRRIRDELELAERAGEMPWEGLRRFGDAVDVDELADLSVIAATAGQDGGAVVDTLLARAGSLRDELAADEHAAARRASARMSAPGALQVFLIAAWVLFPAGTALLSTY